MICRVIIFSLVILLAQLTTQAQLQDNNWCFGYGAGVTFTSPPDSFSSQIASVESVAAVSHRTTGELLFYTDGYQVWDTTHNLMQNGKRIGDDSISHSAAQGAVIIPFANDDDKYYVFSLNAVGKLYGRLQYSVVDMSLNNGKGGVVATQKKVLLGQGYTEAMTTIQGCGRVWLLAMQAGSGDMHAYELNEQGLNTTPVVSVSGYKDTIWTQGYIKGSPDGSTLAVICNMWYGMNSSFLVLYSFDKGTGKLSDKRFITYDMNNSMNGCEFSPDGTRLYLTSGYDGLLQYDLTLSTPAQIAASVKTVDKNTYMAGLQMAPDGNIYTCSYEGRYLNRLSNPNALFPNCVYTEKAIHYSGSSGYRLPQKVWYPDTYKDAGGTAADKTLCNDQPLQVAIEDEHTWQDGATEEIYTITSPGTYWVQQKDNSTCTSTTDTFYVAALTVQVQLGNDTTICNGDTITLAANPQAAGTEYAWNTGSKEQAIPATHEGHYTLAVNYKGCADTAGIAVIHHPISSIDLGEDRELCDGDEMMLPGMATVYPGDALLWQDGATSDSFTVQGPGKYYVQLTNVCQTIRDSVFITRRNCYFFFPDVFTPNSDGLNDIARLVGDVGAIQDYSLRIYSRWGEVVYHTDDVLSGWNGKYRGLPADVGTYYYMIKYVYKGQPEMMKGTLQLIR